MELVSSVTQLIDNIKRYNEHAAKFAELMPYNRSWYALSTEAGCSWDLRNISAIN